MGQGSAGGVVTVEALAMEYSDAHAIMCVSIVSMWIWSLAVSIAVVASQGTRVHDHALIVEPLRGVGRGRGEDV